MIIDCHCHTGKGDLMTAPWNTDAPLEPYLRRARAAGIDKTVVFSVFHSDYAKSNPQVARAVARHPDRLIGFVMVHAKRDKDRIFRMVKHAVTKWGFRGMKVHGLEAPPNREICEAARAFRLPVLIDVGIKPEVMEMLAPQYRDELHRSPSRQLHRRLEGAPDDGRPDRASSERLYRYFLGPTLRLHRAGDQARGTA